jgi:hypothetical protein
MKSVDQLVWDNMLDLHNAAKGVLSSTERLNTSGFSTVHTDELDKLRRAVVAQGYAIRARAIRDKMEKDLSPQTT